MEGQETIKCSNCGTVLNIEGVIKHQIEENYKVKYLSELEKERKTFYLERRLFVREFVHESLSPLAEILHQSEFLLSRIKRGEIKVAPNIHHYFENINNNIFLFKNMVLGLEDAAAVESKEFALNLEVQNVKDILLDVVKLFEETAKFKNIFIKININRLPNLLIDKNRITQVFVNLLKNAINYSNQNTEIVISYEEILGLFHENETNKKWHEIKFNNYGIGIPEVEEKDIFKLYYRASNAIKAKPSGRGIGLYLIRKIMEAHGGLCLIRSLSTPTRISVLFPAD